VRKGVSCDKYSLPGAAGSGANWIGSCVTPEAYPVDVEVGP